MRSMRQRNATHGPFLRLLLSGTMLLSRFAAVMGTLFVTVGLLGFGSAFVSAPLSGDPSVTVDQAYGRLFGCFPSNVLHNVVHLAIGIAGLLAWRNVWSPLTYAQFLGGFYGVLTVLGLIRGATRCLGSCRSSRMMSGSMLSPRPSGSTLVGFIVPSR